MTRPCAFEEALYQLKLGKSVARTHWLDEDWSYVFLVPKAAAQIPHKHSNGYPASAGIWMKLANDTIMPWIPSTQDLLTDDWHVVNQPVRQDQLVNQGKTP